jgi:molecular chaperone DnaK (HSP70)
MSKPIGIDLGTTFSAISKWEKRTAFTGAEVYNIPSETSDTLASKVFLEPEGEDEDNHFIVGKIAQQSGINEPDAYVHAVKRMMDEGEKKSILLRGNSYSPVDISSEILKALLDNVENVEGPGSFVPHGVVVTTPYYFKQHQNLNTKNATLQALKALYGNRHSDTDSLFMGLIPEPIAAGLDYAFTKAEEGISDEKFLVFDLGGGTFDVTIFSLDTSNSTVKFEVLAIDGNDRLGGEDFDKALFNWVLEEEGISLEGISEKEKKRAIRTIEPAITEMKITLSSMNKTTLMVPMAVGTQNIQLDVRRKDLEKVLQGEISSNENYLSKIELILDNVLNKAGLDAEDIQSVLMVGGSSKIPVIKEIVESKVGANKTRNIANMDTAVSRGAAIYCAYMLDKKLEEEGKKRKHLSLWNEIIIKERTAHQIGFKSGQGFYKVLPDNMITPAIKSIPVNISQLSEDGTRGLWNKLTVLQGNKNNYSEIGHIVMPEIYAHGRKANDIKAKITFIAESSLIKVQISIPKSNEDGTDIIVEQDLSLENN